MTSIPAIEYTRAAFISGRDNGLLVKRSNDGQHWSFAIEDKPDHVVGEVQFDREGLRGLLALISEDPK